MTTAVQLGSRRSPGMTPVGGEQGDGAPITISRPKPQPPQSLTAHPANRIRTRQTLLYSSLIHPARREARRTLRGNGQVGVGVSCVDQADPRGSQLSCLARSAENPAVPGARAFLLLKNPAGRSRPGAPSTPPTGGTMPMDASGCPARPCQFKFVAAQFRKNGGHHGAQYSFRRRHRPDLAALRRTRGRGRPQGQRLQSRPARRRASRRRHLDRRRHEGPRLLCQARRHPLGRRRPVHGVHARADAAGHHDLRRQGRPVHLHFLGLGLPEAAARLRHHRTDSGGEPLLALQPGQDRLRNAREAVQGPALDHRPAQPHRALGIAQPDE